MPVVNHKEYLEMLESAYKNHYAYPAINVSNMETANAALKGFADSKSDGIIEISIGGGKHASGQAVGDSVIGAISLANHIHLMAEKYDVRIALHTDHCTSDKVESFLMPLIEETKKRRARGEKNLFNSHMYDGSDVSIKENIVIAEKLLKECAANEIILEVEAGVVGGEEDGMNNEDVAIEKLYTTPEDMLQFEEALSKIEGGIYMLAATFGNVHGVYKPGNVKLKPIILKEGQEALKKAKGEDAKYYLVFHGGSGSSFEEIQETLQYGVIKMNIDTDTQYAFSRPVTDHIIKNYDNMLKIDGEVGNKKIYDPRAYLKKGENGMAKRVQEACKVLNAEGKTLFK